MKNIYVVNIYWKENGTAHTVQRYFTNKVKATKYKKWRDEFSDAASKTVWVTKEKVNEYDTLLEG